MVEEIAMYVPGLGQHSTKYNSKHHRIRWTALVDHPRAVCLRRVGHLRRVDQLGRSVGAIVVGTIRPERCAGSKPRQERQDGNPAVRTEGGAPPCSWLAARGH